MVVPAAVVVVEVEVPAAVVVTLTPPSKTVISALPVEKYPSVATI